MDWLGEFLMIIMGLFTVTVPVINQPVISVLVFMIVVRILVRFFRNIFTDSSTEKSNEK
jgi:hypothetical protein